MNNSILLPALLSLGLLVGATASANNIQVTNASLTGNTGTSVKVQFDISWENSWRGGGVSNWDAAWVFVKYRSGPVAAWQHLRLSNAGHVAPAGSQIDIGLVSPGVAYNASSNPVVGVFLSRNTAGNGTFSMSGVQLLVDLAAAGAAYNDLAEIQVLAIEMVHVPQGTFAVANTGGTNDLVQTTINTGDPAVAPSGSGILGGQAGGRPTGISAPNANWPNGFKAFYCMKYEVTQQGYVDFLNTLSYSAQATRTATAPNSAIGTGALSSINANRNGIDIRIPGVDPGTPAIYGCNLTGNGVFDEANDGLDIACNWLSWADLAAYLDWTGLRPMTELEYEKACRGPKVPVPNELASGSSSISTSPYSLFNAGTTNEGIASNYSTSSTNVNHALAYNLGPMRVGIFAANGGNSGRVTSGASYYGIMEMSGNVFELAVSIVGAGNAFNGTHGDGHLDLDNGGHNTISWPAAIADGVLRRGGSWNFDTSSLLVSFRGAALILGDRSSGYGGRGVRTAP